MPAGLDELLPQLCAWLTFAPVAAALAALLWFRLPRGRRRLWPPRRRRAAPWTGVEIVVVFFLVYGAQVIAVNLLGRAGFFSWLYGPEFPPPPALGDTTSRPLDRQ